MVTRGMESSPVVLEELISKGAAFTSSYEEELETASMAVQWISEQNQDDYEVLRKRVFPQSDKRIPEDAVHIFATNQEVNFWNQVFLDKLSGEEFVVETIVNHPVLKNFRVNVDPSGFIHNTSLLKTLKFKIGSKVMLTTSLCTVDALTNGAFGMIVGVKKNDDGKILEIHVRFVYCISLRICYYY